MRVTVTLHTSERNMLMLAVVHVCVCRCWVGVSSGNTDKVLIGAHFCTCVVASEEPVCHSDTKKGSSLMKVCMCVYVYTNICVYMGESVYVRTKQYCLSTSTSRLFSEVCYIGVCYST